MPFQVKHFAPRERGTRLHSHRVLLSLSLSRSFERAHLDAEAKSRFENLSSRDISFNDKTRDRTSHRVIAIVRTLRNRGWMRDSREYLGISACLSTYVSRGIHFREGEGGGGSRLSILTRYRGETFFLRSM